ncbi:response regulator transcription factor [Paenibacillus alkaliterrae]|uniref:winged helix-turn-helix transcriptional regulator n=1 Tax=Paenibacillus alkaliterrae TaxID=320909 RepID=UPI001F356C41|nr:response regulator transcription factor [Paenibacillus alkaliterrae]MCF2938443.1 response regulator transcription factor [Paenibacillus alkaliterrae]
MRDEINIEGEMTVMAGSALDSLEAKDLDDVIPGQAGMLCSLTQRVMIISPLPERVKSLLVALSAECFDVFSLHDFNKSMLQSLQPELLVYDAIPVIQAQGSNTLQAGAELLQSAERDGVPVLILLDSKSYETRDAAALGAAELLVWPAKPEEALQVINRMLLNRPASAGSPAADDMRSFKDIQINLKRMTVDRGGKRIDLTKTEYDLLLHFISSDGSVLTRESLLDSVWGLQFYGGSNLVDAHIKSLRKKLKDSAVAPKYIVTVRGAGYRLADDRDTMDEKASIPGKRG